MIQLSGTIQFYIFIVNADLGPMNWEMVDYAYFGHRSCWFHKLG